MTIDSHHIDGLEITRFLARGGSASVYEALDSRHSRRVAVKIFDRSDVEERRRRAFRREIKAMGRLDDHPNVLSVFDSGFTHEGAPYLVMPLVSTGTAAARIARDESFDIEELVSIAVKLTSALATAHQRGILHCDIKPSNIFLGQFGDPMLGDLGISSVSDSGITTTSQVSMTLRYAAPEVISDSGHTEQSDLYSLGATLFAMIDLSPPFSAGSSAALVAQIMSAVEPPVLERSVPAGLAELLSDLMAIKPHDRPPSALVVVDRLQEIQRANGLAVTPSAVAPVANADEFEYDGDTLAPDAAETTATASPLRRLTRVPAMAAALLVLVVAGAAIWWASGWSADSSLPVASQPLVSDQVAGVTVVADDTNEPPPDELAPAVVIERPAAEAVAEVAAAAEPDPPGVSADMNILGVVLLADGQPVEALVVDLFVADESLPRGDFLDSFETGPDGRYGFTAAEGCYVLTFVASNGVTFDDGGLFKNVDVCVTSGEVANVDEVVSESPNANAQIAGSIRFTSDGAPAEGVSVDAFVAASDGNRGDFVGTAVSGATGSYEFDLAEGCYILTVVAPEGHTLVGGDEFLNSPALCVDVRTGASFDAELN